VRSRRTMITTRLFRMGVFAFVLVLPFIGAAAAPDQGSPDARGPTATSSLIREIQFMLLSLGFDPGPIDGNARLLTNRAARLFQQRNGLPGTDVVNNYPISPSFLETLRREAAQVLLKNARPETPGSAPVARPQTESSPTAPRDEAAGPASKPPPIPPDRFANCSYSPQDFTIGTRQYTPQTFLDEGFGGTTSRAVDNLRQRLEEARQIAEKIGGSALLEVQRQARVLSYFECRQKIEQASTTSR
jgi:peptidoglycan hydrolase-like protein with peptidoglycan-binding domain